MNAQQGAAAVVFAITFLALALGRVGRMHLPRGWASLAGGVATMLILRVDPRVIDLQILGLLGGLMILAGLAEAGGLFAGIRRRLLHRRPGAALWVMLLLVAGTSALLLNDAAVVVLVPFLIPLVRRLGLAPVPAVALMAVAANVGSLLTPFGNPQNAVLAAHAGLGMVDFLRVQGPIAVAGLAVLAVPCHLLGRKATPDMSRVVVPQEPIDRVALLLCIAFFVVAAIVQAPFGLGGAAMIAAGCAWLATRAKQGRAADRTVWNSLDLNVLLLFVGLYLLTGGLDQWFPSAWLPFERLDTPWTAGAATTLLSNTVGNVPAILSFIELDPTWVDAHAQFLVTVSTLGGTLLLTGSAASLLAADQAKKHGIEVRFHDYLMHAAWIIPVLLAGAWWTF